MPGSFPADQAGGFVFVVDSSNEDAVADVSALRACMTEEGMCATHGRQFSWSDAHARFMHP